MENIQGEALRKYYSQHGEDALLDLIFGNQKDGFFIEVGCIDGKCFSNTLTFEGRGWKGLCVEAHASYIDALRHNRPNSLVCHCAAGEADEDATFYANARGSLSSLDKTTETRWKRDYSQYFLGFEEQPVKKVRLSTLLDENHIGEIDILSLDIEGYEVEAMKGMDLNRHRPKVMVIESDSNKHERLLDEIVLPHGYTKSIRFHGNLFYVRDKKLDSKIREKRKSVYLTHTQHPLDGKGKWIERIVINQPEVKIGESKLMRMIRKLVTLKNTQLQKRDITQFMEIGFHGDKYLLALSNYIASNSAIFIETGANVGSTLAYIAKNHPKLDCLSCEPDPEAFVAANAYAGKYQNVSLFKGTSQEFITYLKGNESWVFAETCLFWLDAHGYGFEWPLVEELEFITHHFHSGYILIDDFKVPGRDQFGYDVYQKQICSFDYIKNSLNPNISYRLYYPTYENKTSNHHPLRGWGLLVFGRDDFQIPVQLADKMEEVEL